MKKRARQFWFDEKTYQDMCRDFVVNHSQLRTVKTRNECQIVLRAFRRWLIENGHTDIDEEIIKMWMLDNVRKAGAKTVSGKSIMLSHFLDYLISQGVWTGNSFVTLRKQHLARGYYGIAHVLKETSSISELDALVDTPFSGKLAHHFLYFIEYEKALGKIFENQSGYLASFERYLRHKKITDLTWIDSRLVAEWNESFGPSSAYQKRVRLMMVKQFLDFLHGQERIRTVPIQQLPPLRRRLLRPYIFSREEVKRILDAAERLPDHRIMPRRGPTYRMLFLTLYRKMLFPDFIPQMLYRIALRTIGRQPIKTHIGRYDQVFCTMPSSSVHKHQNEFIRMSGRYFRKEKRHGIRVDFRQYQGVKHSVERTDGGKCVCVFSNELCWYFRSYPLGCPTAPRVADPAESAFILKHQPDGFSLPRPALSFFR